MSGFWLSEKWCNYVSRNPICITLSSWGALLVQFVCNHSLSRSKLAVLRTKYISIIPLNFLCVEMHKWVRLVVQYNLLTHTVEHAMIRILLADDHTMFRQGLKTLLSSASGIEVAAEAENTAEILSIIKRNQLDVVVLDISMPGRDGIDIMGELREAGLQVLILSMHPEESYALRAFRLGVSGYLTKRNAAQDLEEAIRIVAAGRRYISAAVAEQLAIGIDDQIDGQLHDRLSDREYQVLCMLAKGKTVKTIADELCLSISTVSTNRTRILSKMRMKHNAELIYYAIKNGLVK